MTELNLTNGTVDVKVRYTDFSFSVEFKNGSRKLYHEATIEDLMRRLNASKKTIRHDIEGLTDATDYPFGEECNCKERYFELF